jgi:hypothetical protein
MKIQIIEVSEGKRISVVARRKFAFSRPSFADGLPPPVKHIWCYK